MGSGLSFGDGPQFLRVLGSVCRQRPKNGGDESSEFCNSNRPRGVLRSEYSENVIGKVLGDSCVTARDKRNLSKKIFAAFYRVA